MNSIHPRDDTGLPRPRFRLAIGLPVRNVASYLPRLLDVLHEVASNCEDARIVIAENDSADATGEISAAFVGSDPRFSLLQYPGLAALVPVRTDRLAFLRNSIVEEFLSTTNPEDDWTAVMLDADEVTSALKSSDVLELVRFLKDNSQYCAATANSQPAYYDVWTLRCEGWSPDDCWTQVSRRPAAVSQEQAIQTFVAGRQRRIPPDSEPIAVASAFGGLAVYHLADLTTCRYAGTDAGEECSDHIPVHSELTALTGKPMAIVPGVNVIAPAEHLADKNLLVERPPPSSRHSLRVSRAGQKALSISKRAGRRLAVRSRIAAHLRRPPPTRRLTSVDEFCLLMDPDHALSRYGASFRAYDRPIRSIGLALRRSHGRRIRVIDVGANIGDTTVALVVATGADVLAIEGDPKYLATLRTNMSALGDRVTVYDDFVTSGGAAFARSSGTGRPLDEHEGSIAGGPNIETRALRQALTEVGWDSADLFKSDTDGHHFELIGAALEFPWREKPVLFFEFDPSLDTCGAAAGLAVIDHAISKGYRRWYVWDNFGNFIAQVDHDHLSWFEQLCAYLANCKQAGGGVYYLDVAAFGDHHPPYDGTVELRPK